MRLGLVRRLEMGHGTARYEAAHPSGEHHHHLVCDRCGKVRSSRIPSWKTRSTGRRPARLRRRRARRRATRRVPRLRRGLAPPPPGRPRPGTARSTRRRPPGVVRQLDAGHAGRERDAGRDGEHRRQPPRHSRAVAAGATRIATTSSEPSACVPTTTAAAMQISSATSVGARPGADQRRRTAVEADGQQPVVQQRRAPPAAARPPPAVTARSPRLHGQRVAEQDGIQPARRGGRQRQQHAGAERVVTTTAVPRSRSRPRTEPHGRDRGGRHQRADRRRRARAGCRAGRPTTSPGKSACDRLSRRIRQAVQDDPAADAGGRDARPARARPARRRRKPWWNGASASVMVVPVVVVVRRAGCRAPPPGTSTIWPPYVSSTTPRVSTTSGAAVRDLAVVQAQHAVPGPRLVDVVRRDQQRVAVGGELVDQLQRARGAGRVHAAERLVEQQQRARPARARGPAARAGAGRRTARRSGRRRGRRGRRAPAPSARARRSARPGRRHQGSRESVPISATSSALTG